MVGEVGDAELTAFAVQRPLDHTRGGPICPWHRSESCSTSANKMPVHLVSPPGSL